MALKKERCENCQKPLTKIVYLELSQTDGNYYKKIPEGHTSQGFFTFGSDCAKQIIKNQKMIYVKCTYADGDVIKTGFNGTFEDAEKYFLGKVFNIGSVNDNLQECVKVDLI